MQQSFHLDQQFHREAIGPTSSANMFQDYLNEVCMYHTSNRDINGNYHPYSPQNNSRNYTAYTPDAREKNVFQSSKLHRNISSLMSEMNIKHYNEVI